MCGTLSRLDWAEGAALLLAAPVLLVPSARPVLTVGALVGLVAVWLVRLLRRDPVPMTPLNGAMLVWLIMVGVGAGVTAFPELMLPKATGILLAVSVWMYLARLGARSVSPWTMAFGLGALGFGVAGLGVLMTDWPAKVPFLSTVLAHLPPVLLRVPGTPDAGVHANELAGAVAPFVPLALSLILSRPAGNYPRSATSWLARVLIGVGLLSLALTVLSQSRSAWIGVLGGSAGVAALWAWLSPSRRLALALRVALLIGLVGVVGVGLWLGPDGMQRILDEPGQMQALGGLGTVGFRLAIWRWAAVAVSDFAFTGCGLGAFREVGRLLYPLAIPLTYDYAHAHNIFLQVALDTGIPGLVAYLALLGASFAILWRAARANPDLRPLAIGMIGGMVALHVYGLTDAVAPGAKPGLVYWVLLGLAGVIGSGPMARRRETDDRNDPASGWTEEVGSRDLAQGH